MATKHQLSLEMPESNNPCVLRVFDTSTYAEDLQINCGYLRITSPGYNLPVAIEVQPHFNLVLNACTLGLQTEGCGTDSEVIPDGIYVINYTVSPNSSVYTEYNYLRVTQTHNRYMALLAELEMGACEPDADIKEKLKELRLIKSFIEAAKAKVEYAHEPEAGMDIFVYAKKRLERLSTLCAC